MGPRQFGTLRGAARIQAEFKHLRRAVEKGELLRDLGALGMAWSSIAWATAMALWHPGALFRAGRRLIGSRGTGRTAWPGKLSCLRRYRCSNAPPALHPGAPNRRPALWTFSVIE